MKIKLQEADRLEVIVLVDNLSDELLEDTDVTCRMRLPSGFAPLAEPGLSLLIKVHKGNTAHTLLMDTGMTGIPLMHNLNMLHKSRGVREGRITAKGQDIESVVISHGHSDHFNGLGAYLASRSQPTKVIVHPKAFVKRQYRENHFPAEPMISLGKEQSESLGARFDLRESPSLTAADLVLVSGQVNRTTIFEKGHPCLEARIKGLWKTDPFDDDQALAIHVRGKGLVVLSGCSHAGIINILHHVRKVTGIENIHAVMGGFHLPGPDLGLAEKTVNHLISFSPDIVVPMHCTGWYAGRLIAERMPVQFILNSVGTTYLFNGTPKKESHYA